MEKIERTVVQQLAADKADFDRVTAELLKEGFVEEFKRNWGIPIQSSIQIKKSPSADSRTPRGDVSKEELLNSTLMHIGDVQKVLSFLANKLIEAGTVHDHTKISGIDDFYNDFKNVSPGDAFKAGKWFSEQHLTERHHLPDRCPDDVNLIDVMERVADSVAAGMARSGSVYDDPIDPEILQKAYKNTFKLLIDNVEVID
ncbi:MAG: hypothetical protein FWH35_00065 [Treponema sp.]|nr:hypothetical protein [Treponema sp.]